MSERTFRGVVAVVLVLALALVVVVVAATLYRPSPPPPSPSPVIIATPPVSIATPTPSATPTATTIGGPVFKTPSVVSVGQVRRGSSSDDAIVLEFVESQADAIADAPGFFLVSLVDQAGDASTIAFVGEPNIVGPGSLGATVTLARPNVLQIDILSSDTLNTESLTITGLALSASQTAALGPITAEAGSFSGSLEGGLANDALASPGSVVEPQ